MTGRIVESNEGSLHPIQFRPGLRHINNNNNNKGGKGETVFLHCAMTGSALSADLEKKRRRRRLGS